MKRLLRKKDSTTMLFVEDLDNQNMIKKFQKNFKEIRFLDFEQGGKGFAIVEGFKDALKRDNDLIALVVHALVRSSVNTPQQGRIYHILVGRLL